MGIGFSLIYGSVGERRRSSTIIVNLYIVPNFDLKPEELAKLGYNQRLEFIDSYKDKT
jgi:hypothetical protein